MERQQFSRRLAELRGQKGVSARDMSLSLGQSAGYINNIENGANLPSMTMFFEICQYLDITPRDFFDWSTPAPAGLQALTDAARHLDWAQLDHLTALVRDIR